VDPADQPGIHALFANAEEFGGDVTQEPCALTSVLTAGEDGEVGTADDQPATLTDPEIILGPADLDFGVLQGTSVPMLDSIMGGTFGPDLDDLAGGFFTGVMDTRPLDETLDPDGGEGAVCNLMAETVGVFCEECGAPNPGEFCLTITVVDLVNEVIAEPSIVPTGCADIIDAWEMDSECPDEAAVYDPAGDGSYSDCPSWPSR